MGGRYEGGVRVEMDWSEWLKVTEKREKDRLSVFIEEVKNYNGEKNTETGREAECVEVGIWTAVVELGFRAE